MANTNLRSRIEEDHLTCSICCQTFTCPRALPCLHTFCEHCLREYVASRGYEASGEFPCPFCRVSIQIPVGGVGTFPMNHLVTSLSDTVDNTKTRPTPKPRKSLQPKNVKDDDNDAPPPYTPTPVDDGGSIHPSPGSYSGVNGRQESHVSSAKFNPPPGPEFNPPPPGYSTLPPGYPPSQVQLPPYPPPSSHPTQTVPSFPSVQAFVGPVAPSVQSGAAPNPYIGPAVYPTIPPPTTEADACTQGLQLKFGKKGADLTDFSKPFGLAVSDDCHYIITDLKENRIFVFDYSGKPVTAFRCKSQIKDVAVNGKNEILVVVNKPGAVLQCYDMSGKCVGQYGKYITHDETHGIAVLNGGGAVITGTKNHNVYIMTENYNLSSKFGTKGTGDGNFQLPAFVSTDSKDHIIVSDTVNHNIQVFNRQGKFKLRFGGKGTGQGQLFQPMGLVSDADDNIIVADSGNHRVEMFSARGAYIRTIVNMTHLLGEDVRPVNVAMTPRGSVAVLLNGNYFAEVRVYNPYNTSPSRQGHIAPKDSTTWYLVN